MKKHLSIGIKEHFNGCFSTIPDLTQDLNAMLQLKNQEIKRKSWFWCEAGMDLSLKGEPVEKLACEWTMARNVSECKPSWAEQQLFVSLQDTWASPGCTSFLRNLSLDLADFSNRAECMPPLPPPLDFSCVPLNKAVPTPRTPHLHELTSLSPPSRRNPRWVHGDKESPAVQTGLGGRLGCRRDTSASLLCRNQNICT